MSLIKEQYQFNVDNKNLNNKITVDNLSLDKYYKTIYQTIQPYDKQHMETLIKELFLDSPYYQIISKNDKEVILESIESDIKFYFDFENLKILKITKNPIILPDNKESKDFILLKFLNFNFLFKNDYKESENIYYVDNKLCVKSTETVYYFSHSAIEHCIVTLLSENNRIKNYNDYNKIMIIESYNNIEKVKVDFVNNSIEFYKYKPIKNFTYLYFYTSIFITTMILLFYKH
jgi:hypothetical protein